MRKFGIGILMSLALASPAQADRLPRSCASRPSSQVSEFHQFDRARISLARAMDAAQCGSADEAGVLVTLRMLDAIQYQGDPLERAIYRKALRDAIRLFYTLDSQGR